MLAKSLVTMEGLIEKLDPKFNVLEVVEPMTKKLIIKMFSISDIRRTLLKETPLVLVNFCRKFEDDDFVLNHEIKGAV